MLQAFVQLWPLSTGLIAMYVIADVSDKAINGAFMKDIGCLKNQYQSVDKYLKSIADSQWDLLMCFHRYAFKISTETNTNKMND